jgi:hypothetical protein
MRKLTAAQSESVSQRKGLFTLVMWQGCVAHLHALLTDDDPSNTESFALAMLLIRTFVDWALQVAKKRFGALGYECLLLASQKEMQPELEHTMGDAPCVFSGRAAPLLYTSTSQAEPAPAYLRVQRKFTWWAHHEQTGLECPHASPAFVYESRYSYLVTGMYALGHLGSLLKHQSRVHATAGLEEFQAAPIWAELHCKINEILFVVHAQLVLL